MKLLLKVNILLVLVFLIGLAASYTVAQRLLLDNARSEIQGNARIMMESALAVRAYTVSQIKPLLDTQMHYRFLPQTVSAYAATEYFNNLRKTFPEYSYKEATLNPTNPRDRATDWESDVVNQFRGNSNQAEFISSRESPTGTALFLARPIRINNVSCLECHSTPDKAPTEMIKLYGGDNGFGGKLDDLIGAQIVSVPVSLPVHIAENAFRVIITWLGGAFGGILIVANIAVAIVARQRPS